MTRFAGMYLLEKERYALSLRPVVISPRSPVICVRSPIANKPIVINHVSVGLSVRGKPPTLSLAYLSVTVR